MARVPVTSSLPISELKWYDSRVFIPSPCSYGQYMCIVCNSNHPEMTMILPCEAMPTNNYTEIDWKITDCRGFDTVLAFMPNPKVETICVSQYFPKFK